MQIYQSIDTAEGELEALEARMAKASFNLDTTLSVKQGQLEVEQAAVVTDYSDAVVVEKEAIEMLNGSTCIRQACMRCSTQTYEMPNPCI